MDNKPQNRYSVIALIVSLIALIVTLFAGVLQILINIGSFTTATPETYTLVLQISAALILIGVAVYAILEPDSVRRFLSGRQARYGSNALVLILAFTGIVVVSNYLMATNATLSAVHADLTENRANTLSPEMTLAMESLPGKLTATGFFSSQTPTDTARKLFDNMKASSNGKFTYSFIDPDKNPVAAKEAGITGDGKILLEMNGRKEIAAYADEGEILSALNRILNPEARTVYFLTGHGEHDINGSGQSAFSRARDTLEKKNFTVKTLNLLAENAIPADAKAIIIAGPTKPISETEASLLIGYALRGGALVVMEDPIPLTEFGDSLDPLAISLDSVWGLRLRNDFVVDTASTSSSVAVGAVFDPASQITQSITQVAVLPLTRSIEIKKLAGFTQIALVQTSPKSQSWGETDFTALKGTASTVSLDPAKDTPGPVTLVASSEKQDGGRVVVFGSSVFATDQGFDAYGNSDLFVNSVAWAAGQAKTMDVTPKSSTARTFHSPSQGIAFAIYAGTICGIPLLMIVAGAYAWVSRRRRG
jgi:ABC-type uncharacterized transport system involved in gliding motility auxiliary subunit